MALERRVELGDKPIEDACVLLELLGMLRTRVGIPVDDFPEKEAGGTVSRVRRETPPV